MSNIIMPAAFGPLGIPGVAASADLPANKVFFLIFYYHDYLKFISLITFIKKAIIAVPFTLIIS